MQNGKKNAGKTISELAVYVFFSILFIVFIE